MSGAAAVMRTYHTEHAAVAPGINLGPRSVSVGVPPSLTYHPYVIFLHLTS